MDKFDYSKFWDLYVKFFSQKINLLESAYLTDGLITAEEFHIVDLEMVDLSDKMNKINNLFEHYGYRRLPVFYFVAYQGES